MSVPVWQDVLFSEGPSGLRSRERPFGLLWLVSVEGYNGWAFCVYQGPAMSLGHIGPLFSGKKGAPCWSTREEAEAAADAWADKFAAALAGGGL